MGKANNLGFKTSKSERMSYGGFFVGQNIVYMFVLSFITIFYTDVVGLTTGAVATLLLVARVWDAINDPMLGGLVDRTTPKKGKFLPWIKAVGILMPIATILLFFKISGNGTINLVYAYLSYIIWGMIYTISDVPIFAIVTTMTDNNDERVSLMSLGRLAAGIAGIIAAVIGAPMIDSLGFTTAAIVLSIIALITMIPIRFKVKERLIRVRDKDDKVTLKTMIEAVIKNKYLIVFYASFLMILGLGTHMTAGVYFAKYNLGDLSLQAVLMLGVIAPMLIIPIIAPSLIRRFGKRKIFITLVSIGIVFSVIQYFVGYDNFALFMILNVIKSVGLFSPTILMGMFSADCAEYGAYVTGKRNEGVTFSIQTFSTKLSSAFSGALGVFLIGKFGYVKDAAIQSQQTLDGIWNLMTLVPLVGAVLGLIIFVLFYKLDEKEVERMIKEMEVRDGIIVE